MVIQFFYDDKKQGIKTDKMDRYITGKSKYERD